MYGILYFCHTKLYRNMKDYKKHLTLLPHKWQVVGITVSCIVLIPYIILHHRLAAMYPALIQQQIPSDGYNAPLPWAYITKVIVSAFLMLCCLSEEKEEDEYTISVRYRALTIAVTVFFLSRAAREMIYGGLHSFSELVYNGANGISSADPMRAVRDYCIGSPCLEYLDRIAAFFASLPNIQILYIVLLKILKRIGSGVRYRSIMLPHRCRKTGWWVLAASIIVIPISIILLIKSFSNVDPYEVKDTYKAVMRLPILLPYIAIILICLSREKQEDELISHIRARLLAFFAIYYMVMSFVSTGVLHVLATAANNAATDNSIGIIYCFHITNTIISKLLWVPLVAVIYSLVLRKVLSNNLKESCNEE